MKIGEVKKAEEIVGEMAKKNEEVYARETKLAVAKSIQGLRAVFDEVRHFVIFWLSSFGSISLYDFMKCLLTCTSSNLNCSLYQIISSVIVLNILKI